MAPLVHIFVISSLQRHIIIWLGYFGGEKQGSPLRSWILACWLWRRIPIVTSPDVPASWVVTQTLMGTNSSIRRTERQFSLCFRHGDHGKIEVDHSYDLCRRGWYGYLAQHLLCQSEFGLFSTPALHVCSPLWVETSGSGQHGRKKIGSQEKLKFLAHSSEIYG